MDSTLRLLTKATTWQLSGFFMMLLIGYVFTGSFAASGGIAVAGTIAGFVCYFLHEMAWSRIEWGRVGVVAAMVNSRACKSAD